MDVAPLELVYEDFLQSLDRAVSQVLDFLEIDVPEDMRLASPTLTRQADALSEQWVERYRALSP